MRENDRNGSRKLTQHTMRKTAVAAATAS
jgi:hypothetical protein